MTAETPTRWCGKAKKGLAHEPHKWIAGVYFPTGDVDGYEAQCPGIELLTIPAELLAGLSEVYTESGRQIWWTSRNANLRGSVPQQLWSSPVRQNANRREITEEVEQLTGGFSG